VRLDEPGGLLLVKAPLVCRAQATGIACPHGLKALESGGTGRPQRIVRDQTAPREAQAEFAPVGVQLLRGTIAIIGLARQTMGSSPPPGGSTARQGDGGHPLDRGRGMAAQPYEATLDRSLHLPEVGGLPYAAGARREGGEARRRGRLEIRQEVRSMGSLEKCAAHD
jgi:hypothetical protein